MIWGYHYFRKHPYRSLWCFTTGFSETRPANVSGDVWHASKRTVDAPQVFNLPPCDRFPSPSALPRRSCEPKKSHSRNPQAVSKGCWLLIRGEKKGGKKETLKVWGANTYLKKEIIVWMIFIWKKSKDDCHRKCWIIPITLCCMFHLLVGHLSQFQFNSWLQRGLYWPDWGEHQKSVYKSAFTKYANVKVHWTD